MNKTGEIKGWVLTAINALLILLWTYAALSKLLHYSAARDAMMNQVFPEKISGILTWFVPLCELGVAILLLLPQTARTGYIFSAGMLTAFSVYIALGLFRIYPRLPCSCGGILSAMSWPQHLLFNLVFLALNLCALIFHRHQHHLQIPDTRQTPFGAGKAGTEHGDPGTP